MSVLVSVLCFATIHAQEENDSTFAILAADGGSIYAINADESGNIDVNVADSSSWIRLVPNADATEYTAKNVNLNKYFAIYGFNHRTGTGTLYSVASWAQKPLITGIPNPLGITQKGVIEVIPGAYDILFVPRGDSHYHLLTLNIAEDIPETYPTSLYLLSDKNEIVEIPRNTTDYPDKVVYEKRMSLPSGFRISYEPRVSDAFVLGPISISESKLIGGIGVDIAHGVNTSQLFTYSPTAKTPYVVLNKGADAFVYVDMGKTPAQLIVYTPVISGVDALVSDDASEHTFEIFNINGVHVGDCNGLSLPTGLASGVYIVRDISDGHCLKTVIRN